MSKIYVLLPDLLNLNETGYLQGFSKSFGNTKNVIYFITNTSLTKQETNSVGYCSNAIPNDVWHALRDKKWIQIDNKKHEIIVYNENKNQPDIMCIYYNYETFQKSEMGAIGEMSYNCQFDELKKAVQCSNVQERKGRFDPVMVLLLQLFNFILKVINKTKIITDYSSIIIHIKNTLLIFKWLLTDRRKHRKCTIQSSNIMVSKLVDILMGIFATYCLLKYDENIMEIVLNTAEYVIYSLKQVLNTLMGSPAGLKLNFAFNKTLGVFFFYHISLWRVFIQVITSTLPRIFNFFLIAGFFGLSFQVAILTDLITFLTFHVYCLYVYAARLYGVQIYGLRALWKLFMGRKYNPLRNRVDSFQYSHNQLFVGTLGFTVFLFLLPTTFLYYAVFTSFRLSLLLLNRILHELKLVLQSIPLYLVIIWIFQSSKLKGNVHIRKKIKEDRIGFYVTLKTMSLWSTVTLLPPKLFADTASWSGVDILKGIFVGTLL